MKPRYRLENVVRRYRTAHPARHIEALRVPALEVAAGEILGVVGPNGSGKSTLLETLAFLTRPDQGRVLLDGIDVWAARQSLNARRRCPMLLQHTVLFQTTVLKNVMYGLRAAGMRRRQAQERAEHVLREVHLDGLAQRMHRELSGGERRRVALARLLALEPDVMLLDEPTAHVDQANAQLIEATVQHLHETTGMTVILASHDLRQARRLADRIVTLLDGRPYDGTMDNAFTGTFRMKGDGSFAFHGENGLMLQVAPQAIVSGDSDRTATLTDATVHIALDADRLLIRPGTADNACDVGGTIDSVHRCEDRCRVTVRLASGQELHATLPQSDYLRCGLNVGARVCLQLTAGSLRVIGMGQ
ncbi:MAG: ATP-binding cassette domain-containing protein [Pirellulaceae bacterium]|nr:ATP-binding cassette domain-containing protein [Pirellulaceae bacterium]